MRLPAAHQTWSVESYMENHLPFDFPCFVWVFSFVRRSWMFCFHFLSDVDECSLGRSHCSSFATCYNTPGSYKCKCKDGYRGMGHDCKRKSSRTKTKTLGPRCSLLQKRGLTFSPALFPPRCHKKSSKVQKWGENGPVSRESSLKFLPL